MYLNIKIKNIFFEMLFLSLLGDKRNLILQDDFIR